MDTTTDTIESFVKSEYKYGFVSDIETDAFPPGLSEDVVRRIASTKGEPDFMLDWRIKAYRHWQTMTEPHWPNVKYPPINYQDYIYYAVPKPKKKLSSLDEVDPKLLETYEKLGIPLREREILAGVQGAAMPLILARHHEPAMRDELSRAASQFGNVAPATARRCGRRTVRITTSAPPIAATAPPQ